MVGMGSRARCEGGPSTASPQCGCGCADPGTQPETSAPIHPATTARHVLQGKANVFVLQLRKINNPPKKGEVLEAENSSQLCLWS